MDYPIRTRIASFGTAMVLALTLAVGIAPKQAFALDAGGGSAPETLASAASLDKDNLANGTYTVTVALKNAGKLTTASMAEAALAQDPAVLTVKNGSYSLDIAMTGTVFGEYCNYLGYYNSYQVSGNILTTSGTDVTLKDFNGAAGQPFHAELPLGATARSTGYAALSFGALAMGAIHQDAALQIDWSTLAVKQLDPADMAPLQSAIAEASALEQGSKSAEAFATLRKAIEAANGIVGRGEAASQKEINAGVAYVNSAIAAFKASPDVPAPAPAPAPAPKPDVPAPSPDAPSAPAKAVEFAVGHTYSVPMKIYKSNSSDLSMADQYFGDTANVKVLSDGTYEVSFTTNRSDWVEKLSYNGAAAKIVSSNGLDRTYSIVIPATKANVVLPLMMSIVPMKQLGGGDVSADLHLYLADPNVKDLGTGSQGSPSSGKTGNAPAGTTGNGSGGSSLPQTGDSSGVAGTGAAALAAAALAVGAAAVRRRFQA